MPRPAPRKKIMLPAELMTALREALPVQPGSITRVTTMKRAAVLLCVAYRTVQHWETYGAPAVNGWAYVGVAFRVGGAVHASKVMAILAQANLEGADVWGAGRNHV